MGVGGRGLGFVPFRFVSFLERKKMLTLTFTKWVFERFPFFGTYTTPFTDLNLNLLFLNFSLSIF